MGEYRVQREVKDREDRNADRAKTSGERSLYTNDQLLVSGLTAQPPSR